MKSVTKQEHTLTVDDIKSALIKACDAPYTATVDLQYGNQAGRERVIGATVSYEINKGDK